MSNEPNKPIEAEELTEKELEGIVGGRMNLTIEAEIQMARKGSGESIASGTPGLSCISWGEQVGK